MLYVLMSTPLHSADYSVDAPLLKATLSSQEVWQREQVVISIEVATTDSFARLQIDEFKPNPEQFIRIVELGEQTQHKIQSELTDERYLLGKRWAVFPLQAGETTLKLPRIRYRPSRGSIKTLATPELSLTVKLLPIYVPPTMPVGEISLQSEWQNGVFITTKKLNQWQIGLTGNGVFEPTMPPLSRQLKQTENLQILPEKLERKQVNTDTGLVHQYTYHVPIKAKQWGVLALPDISVQYFDSVLGKIKKTEINNPVVIALSRIQQWIIGLFLTAVLLTLVLILGYKTKHHISKVVEKRKAIESLQQSTNYKEARQAIERIAISYGLGENKTLHHFLIQWQQKYGHSSTLEKAIGQLINYGFDKGGTEDITSLVTLIKNELR